MMFIIASIPVSAAGWRLSLTGCPWWIVLLLAAAAVWGLVRLHQLELSRLAPRTRKQLLCLRSVSILLLILFLMEPALARRTSEQVLPLVAVIIDHSGSMAVKDEFMSAGAKLNEAIGLGLLTRDIRPAKTNASEQAAVDQNVVTNAQPGSAVAKALGTLASLSRHERAVSLARRVVPVLQKRSRVRAFSLDNGLRPFDFENPGRVLPGGATDFEAGFTGLAQLWGQEYLGGVVLLSDGRQTTGADPLPAIRSLHARGALFSDVLVGDPAQPPDAVVAEVSGSSEVFLGETVPLTVRYRVTGAQPLDFDLILSCEGKDLEKRTVTGNGQWQYENFSFIATNAGARIYQARIQLSGEQSADALLPATGSVPLELWNNLGGQNISDLVDSPAFQNAASSRGELTRLQYSNRGQQYGARIRGFLIAPESGDYVFQIASDDASELWVSTDEDPKNKVKAAFVAGFVPQGKWDAQTSQKSRAFAMKAKRPYYFEVLHKQGSGEDHLAIGWRLPSGAVERPIPSSRLASYDEQTLASLREKRLQSTQARTQEWKEASLANNSAECSVVVNQDPIRVLLVDSTPRWESRYLASMFERDRRVALTRRYHSIILQDPNLRLLPRTQAEWDAYDMVCLGDLDGNELPAEQQGFLAEFLARRGGFLVCLAGPRGLPKAFSLGPLANVLPVKSSLQSRGDLQPVTVSLTSAGLDHPVMQILNDAGNNQKLWPLLPSLQWIADSVTAKPGATVLLAAQNPAKTPVVAVQRYGAGRVLWMGTEESWRWRDRLGERVHQTFWLQVMRWGLAGRLRGKDPALQVGLDRYLMAPGETAELKAKTSDSKGEPSREAPMVKIERLGDNGQVMSGAGKDLQMQSMPGALGLWQLSVEGLEEGHWRLTTSPRLNDDSAPREIRELLVRPRDVVEGLDLSADPAALARMAAAGGHRSGTMNEADSVVQDLASKLKPRIQDRRETIRLWNNYVSMGLVLGLLCTEWVMRKRQGLP